MLAAVETVTTAVVEQLASQAHAPPQVTVDFALRLIFAAGVAIASSTGEGTFKVNLV